MKSYDEREAGITTDLSYFNFSGVYYTPVLHMAATRQAIFALIFLVLPFPPEFGVLQIQRHLLHTDSYHIILPREGINKH